MSERPGSSFRERAERLFAARQGDSLGLRHDPESRLLLTEAVAERWAESLDPTLLRDWEEMVQELEQSDSSNWPLQLKWQLQTLRRMLDMMKKVVIRGAKTPKFRTVFWSRRKGNRGSKSTKTAAARTYKIAPSKKVV